jgi:hypothetical protein
MGKISKTFALLLLVIMAMSSLILFDWIPFGLAKNGTNVSGIISLDTIWNKVKSPYTLSSDVTIDPKITLTIEAGTTINLQGHSIITGWGYDKIADVPVLSVLTAIGTVNDPIRFNGGKISLQHTVNSTIQNAVLSATSIEVTMGSPKVSSCTITGDSSGIGIECTAAESPQIIENIISGWDTAIKTGAPMMGYGRGFPQIQANMIVGNRIGILMTFYDDAIGMWDYPKINHNTITGNSGAGIQLEVSGPDWRGGSVSDVEIAQNNIYNNTVNAQAVKVSVGDPASTLIAQNNWWGTSDSTTIKQTLSGDVVYQPYLLEPDSDTSIPNSIPTPIQTTAPTPTVLELSTPTPTSIPIEPNTTSGFTDSITLPLSTFTAIIGVIAVIALLALTLSILSLRSHRKTSNLSK